MIDQQRPSIIIAAYNEAKIIDDTLDSLINTNTKRLYQVIVVCNGCSDATEQIVKLGFPQVHVLSLKQASKALAIRYAESFAPGFPRLYLDADIGLNAEQANTLITASKQQQQPQLIVPGSTLNQQHSSHWVKSFYRHWYSTPHVQQAGYGAGAYLINEAARSRFGEWPELTADDAFIRQQFSANEVVIEHSIKVRVKAPRDLWSLLKVKTRSKYGNLELRHYCSEVAHSSPNSALPSSKSLLLNTEQPSLDTDKKTIKVSVKTNNKMNKNAAQGGHNQTHRLMNSLFFNGWDRLIYNGINLIALCSAKWQFLTGNRRWLRDNSNR